MGPLPTTAGTTVWSRPRSHHGATRSPHVPILVGGTGERRTLRTLARYGDILNYDGWAGRGMSVEVFRHKVSVLERHCEAVGRDPAEIRRSAGSPMRESTRSCSAPFRPVTWRHCSGSSRTSSRYSPVKPSIQLYEAARVPDRTGRTRRLAGLTSPLISAYVRCWTVRPMSAVADTLGMPPMMARIGFSRWAVGSTSTPNASSAVAPSRYSEPGGAKMIGQVRDPSRPSVGPSISEWLGPLPHVTPLAA